MRDGIQSKAKSKPQSWSSIHGGNQLSVLLLQSPTIFIGGCQFDFQLRIPKLRKSAIQNFYGAIGKKPNLKSDRVSSFRVLARWYSRFLAYRSATACASMSASLARSAYFSSAAKGLHASGAVSPCVRCELAR